MRITPIDNTIVTSFLQLRGSDRVSDHTLDTLKTSGIGIEMPSPIIGVGVVATEDGQFFVGWERSSVYPKDELDHNAIRGSAVKSAFHSVNKDQTALFMGSLDDCISLYDNLSGDDGSLDEESLDSIELPACIIGRDVPNVIFKISHIDNVVIPDPNEIRVHLAHNGDWTTVILSEENPSGLVVSGTSKRRKGDSADINFGVSVASRRAAANLVKEPPLDIDMSECLLSIPTAKLRRVTNSLIAEIHDREEFNSSVYSALKENVLRIEELNNQLQSLTMENDHSVSYQQ